jgi:putative ABC transport system permease protein
VFSADEHRAGGPAVAVVRRGFWQDALGGRPLETIALAIGAERVPIVGVLSDDFRFLGNGSHWSRADVWMPLERETDLGGRQPHGYHTVGRLRPGIDLTTADREMAELAAVLEAEHGEPTHADRAELRPLTGVVIQRAGQPVRLLAWAAVAVLLVAALNFAATLFARGVGRAHELSVRLSLGAGRGDLARLHVAEALVLAMPAALAGLLGGALAIRVIVASYPGVLPRLGEVRFDATAAALGALLALGSAVAAACLPAALLSARAVTGHLTARNETGAPRHRHVWNVSLAAEVGAALVLLVASGLLAQSFRAALHVDVGYRADDVLTVEVILPESRYPSPEDRRAGILDAIRRLEELPSAAAVSLTNVLPHVTQAMISGTYPAEDESAFVFAGHRLVTPDFFRLLDIPVLPGAEPLQGDSVYLDALLARRFWPDRSPMGQSIRGGFAGRGTTVSGIVGSVREWSHDMGAIGTVYHDYRRTAFDIDSPYLLVRHRGDAQRAEQEIRQALSAAAPGLPIEVASLDRQVREGLADRRAVLQLVGAFSVIGLFIASAGIYALVAFSVGRRLREAAIRKAVGARPSQVASRMVRAGVGPTIAGVAIGLVAWIPASDVLRALLFDVTPFDPAILVGAAGVLIAASVVASAVPARRAATVEPAVLLRD